jgi:hypothetical protein
LKHKIHEYERRDINGIERQVQSVLDQVYSQQSGLNIQKPLYKKGDFFEPLQPVIDKHGDELVEYKGLNLMN